MTEPTIQRALISVSDKTGLLPFATTLTQLGIEILSTGGTARLLRDNDIRVTDIADYTGFPEMMDGRIKTLHPKVHGALLGRMETDSTVMTEHGINPIDLVVVNLYPFINTIQDPDCTVEHAIENIDIGGPTMLRAAAKNYQRVTVVCDVDDYDFIANEIKQNNGKTKDETRFEMACKAFAATAEFDATVANYLGSWRQTREQSPFPQKLTVNLSKKTDLRYGENPHQRAALYQETTPQPGSISRATLIQGKTLSYNNIADADAALECVREFTEQHACVIVKHANPCGVAIAADQTAAYQAAFACDSTSAFGGIIAFNQALTAKTAQDILDNQFVEVIIAPDVSEDAAKALLAKPNVRVLSTNTLAQHESASWNVHRIHGGLLVQESDITLFDNTYLNIATKVQPTAKQMDDLRFAFTVAKHVKSNTIIYAQDQRTLGIGAGQMSRIDSAKIAAIKASEAGFQLDQAVMASDAFFPFRDAVDAAAENGIKAIIQPGGSIRDEEVIQAADEAGMAMVLTGVRHFRH